MSGIVSTSDANLELFRTKSADELEANCELLVLAQIPHRLSHTKAVFDITTIGQGDGLTDLLIMVSKEDYPKARQVLEESYTDSPLPEGHYLLDASDDEIASVLANPGEWSFYDVAHARKLAEQRQLDFIKVADKKLEHVEALRHGKPAPQWLLILGVLSSLVNGIFTLVIGYSLAYMKEKTPDGDFYTYDDSSRSTGKLMLFFGLFMLIVMPFVWDQFFIIMAD